MTTTAEKLEVGDWFVGYVERADLLGAPAKAFPGEKVRVLLTAPSNSEALLAAKLFAALPPGHPQQFGNPDVCLWCIGTRPTRSRNINLTWWASAAHPNRDGLLDLVAELKAQAPQG